MGNYIHNFLNYSFVGILGLSKSSIVISHLSAFLIILSILWLNSKRLKFSISVSQFSLFVLAEQFHDSQILFTDIDFSQGEAIQSLYK